MSEPNSPSPNSTSGDDLESALFLDLVAQHAEMALMFLGRVPHPQTGKAVLDLETARLFISQLEMLEAKTRGNLSPREQALLKQGLMATRMAFVEVVEAQASKPAGGKEAGVVAGEEAGGPPQDSTRTDSTTSAPESPSSAASEDERKKFVKKY